MGGTTPCGAGRPVDVIEGQDEGQLGRTDTARKEGWLVFEETLPEPSEDISRDDY